MTIGEKIFIEFCNRNRIKFEKISEKESTKTPDFKIKLNKKNIFIEIKDINLNNEEKESIQKYKKNGYAVWGNSKVGNRIRNKIANSSKQLKYSTQHNYSTVLVLYDNRPPDVSILSSYEIKTAMYGFESKLIEGNLVTKSFFGSKKQMTYESRTYISAIGIINNFYEMRLYLNNYAKYPLNIASWKEIDDVFIYKLEKDPDITFSNWIRI